MPYPPLSQAALTNTLSPGDKVVCFRYGQFSHLWIDMMQVWEGAPLGSY